MLIGIGVGRSTHTLVRVDGTGRVEQSFIPNCLAGVEKVVEVLADDEAEKKVAFLGNHRWAMPFAYALKERGIQCFYFPIKMERGSRGRIGGVVKVLGTALMSNIRPRPFFQERKIWMAPEQESRTYRLASEYLQVANEVREAKHHVLDGLSILFPELVPAGTTSKVVKGKRVDLPLPQPQPPGLFTKRMMPVLAKPDPLKLSEDPLVPWTVRELARKSLGRYLPKDLREQTMAGHQQALINYYQQVEYKEGKLQALKEAVSQHRLVQIFGEGDIISVVVAFLGWRAWPYWRELRRFCGLDVSRIDSKGRPRISRVRPEIRQYLYLLAIRTKIGREVTKDVKRRVKKIERLLKYLWKEELKEPALMV